MLTWPFYLVGALYLVGPILAWALLFLLLGAAFLGEAIRADLRITNPPPAIVWGWIVGVFVLLIALLFGHLNWGLDTGQIVKSSIGWAKGWALIAIFILIGSMLKIRREVLIRSQNIVGLCTLLIFPIMFIAPFIGLPAKLFVSPLAATGGPGPEYFSIYLYTLDPETMTPRWQFYAPWSPFAGLLGVTMALFAIEDHKRFWLICGLLGGVIMIYFSKSRMSLVSLSVCIIVPRLMPFLTRPLAWFGLSIGASSLAVFGDTVLGAIVSAVEGFRTARVSSSRVRDTIQNIGYYRWKSEAVWFGHGTVERGPHIVEYMPIGSHHTWYALLFVKGIVGFMTFLLLMVWHLFLVLKDAILSDRGRLPLALMLNLLILTFGENIEIEVYLLWPAFVLLGIHAKELNEKK